MRLFLIPAFACDAALYEAAIELLRADFDCEVAIPEEPEVGLCARAVLERLGSDEPFALWGTSLGGHVAREVALLAPEQARALVLSGALADAAGNPAALEARRAAIRSGDPGVMLEDMARRLVFEHEGRGQAAADAFRTMAARAPHTRLVAQTEALATRPDRTEAMRRLAVPTLFLWGEADAFSLLDGARALAAAMPNAGVAALEECGHLPSLEAPMRAVAAIRRALLPDAAA